MKTRSRIIFMLSSIILGIILVFSLFLYTFISGYAFTDFYKRLETRSNSTAHIYLERENENLEKFREEYLVRLPEERHYIMEVTAEKTLAQQASEHALALPLLQRTWASGVGTYRDNNILYCGIRYKASNGKNYIVVTSARNYYFSKLMSYLARVLIVLVLASAVLIVFVSYWTYQRLIKPVKSITLKVNKIGSENLNIRLPGSENDDELGELIQTINGMLDRLETSFETQNNFISNASHELNTPLTSIIGEADVALARSRTSEEYVETLRSILEEAEKLDKKTKALLYLAQTGFNGKAVKFDKVRIDQLIFDVQETVKRINPRQQVEIDFSTFPDTPAKLKVKGNEQLLHLALSNIILNACKYSHNKPVRVSLVHNQGFISVLVKDWGIGIPKNEIKYIYDPFFRASNTANFEGYGIGLPLTRNIIKIHHGELYVASEENGGTLVEIKLPLGNFHL
ncbi:MAG: HAMP domain-containing protein [Chitinophagaceae bacterium]|nr:HAMP domain-containing protein [Chitinophagaceae bacterium]